MCSTVERSVCSVFAPRGAPKRVAMHSFATTIGIVGAVRMGIGTPWWGIAAWYAGFFVAAHVALVPLMMTAYAARDSVERWMRSVIEQELIRFDLRTYQNQLQRVFPGLAKPPDGDGS